MLKVILVVALFALIIYALIRVIDRRGVQPLGRRPGTRPQPRQQPPRRIAPDDDEDFLRDLDRKRRHPEDPEAPTG